MPGREPHTRKAMMLAQLPKNVGLYSLDTTGKGAFFVGATRLPLDYYDLTVSGGSSYATGADPENEDNLRRTPAA